MNKYLSDITANRDYSNIALAVAETIGVIEYVVNGNKMQYALSFYYGIETENTTVIVTIDLDSVKFIDDFHCEYKETRKNEKYVPAYTENTSIGCQANLPY